MTEELNSVAEVAETETVDTTTQKTGRRGSESQARTRVLLALWDLGKTDVKKGKLTERVTRTNEKSADYQEIFQQLEQDGAIAIDKNGVSLAEKGIQILREGLLNPDFEFDGQIGARTANALLQWMREMDSMGDGGAAASASEKKGASGS